jgi:hypothetical protein
MARTLERTGKRDLDLDFIGRLRRALGAQAESLHTVPCLNTGLARMTHTRRPSSTSHMPTASARSELANAGLGSVGIRTDNRMFVAVTSITCSKTVQVTLARRARCT